MRIFQTRISLLLGSAVIASALSLAGCVSSQKALDSAAAEAADPAAEQASAQTTAGTAPKAGYRDPMVTNTSGAGQTATAGVPAGQQMPSEAAMQQPANIGGMAMQSTRINANAMSIFSAQPSAPQNNSTSTIIQPSDASAYAPLQPGGLPASRGGVFSAPSQQQGQPVPQAQVIVPQQSSDNSSTRLAPSYQNASLATGSLPGGATNALYAAPKQNLLGSLSGLLHKASLPSMTRVAPNGLHVQNDSVQVGCFKPNLLNVIKSLETHFSRPVIVTSGYRDPDHNRMVGGAEESMHKTCDAADIQIDGVSKWDIASYIRSLPNRGGVGTYCHTDSVHLDTGNSRDWNWGCAARRNATPSAKAI